MNRRDLNKLKAWFLQNARDLPWRENRLPYAVWVSEIMLQQTQVAVVIPYFLHWMKRFPTIEALAKAPLEEVIKMWEGLGYYSRVRNLHEGAKYILEKHQGSFPKTFSEIAKIKGIGPYTAGAIASFAFRQRVAAVDGNVMRVLARYYLIEEDIAKSTTLRLIKQLAEDLLPEEESWIVNEALIELGAMVCSKNPKCGECPLKSSCEARLKGKAEQLPVKSKKSTVERLERTAVVLMCGDHILLKHVSGKQVMSGLHEFPYFETAGKEASHEEIRKFIEEGLFSDSKGEKLSVLGVLKELPKVSHSFTRYRVNLSSVLIQIDKRRLVTGELRWQSLKEAEALAFSSGHKQVLEFIRKG